MVPEPEPRAFGYPRSMSRRGPILVIDDDPELRALLKRVLEHDGHRVVTAVDGFEAMNAYETERPSLLFVDLMMPRLDGDQLLRVLGTPRPPVVLVSASAKREEIAAKYGVEGSLAKPFELEDVRRIAREQLGGEKAG